MLPLSPEARRNADEGFVVGDSSKEKLRLLEQILHGRFAFRAELPVSRRSKYGDQFWDWRNPENARLDSYCLTDLTIDWDEIQKEFKFNAAIVEDLKRYTFFRYAYSREVYGAIKDAHPASLVGELRKLAGFLSHVITRLSGDTGLSVIQTLADIQPEDLESASGSYELKLNSRLRTSLKCLGSPILRMYLECGPLQWTPDDISTLDWMSESCNHTERLPEGMFWLLSNSATRDVKHFLRALEYKTEDTTAIGGDENGFLSQLPQFRQVFHEYLNHRMALTSSRKNRANKGYEFWRQSLGRSMVVLDNVIERVHMAAETIIALYTGARLSELTSFKVDCLVREGDQWILRGTVIKHQDLSAPVSQDKWVAIPIVRDAVTALQEISRLTNNKFLFHGSHRFVQNLPMQSSKLRRRATRYLRLVDLAGRWSDVTIHARQFRESLAFELRKAGLGVPFITYQLKHAYYSLDVSINNTTLGYGSIGANASLKAVEDAQFEVLRDIYHPDAILAGGGAERHKARVTEYFRGRAELGENTEEVLRDMASRGGVPLTDVGSGYCLGQIKIVVDGVKDNPPCIGSLRCNPNRCSQGLIPAHKAPLWQIMGRTNRMRAEDPEFAHARGELEEAADECDAVVTLLN